MRWRVGLLVLVLALSACERGRGGGEAPPTTAAPSAIAMALDDLPKGFTVDGSADDTASVDACREVSQVLGERSAFVRGDLQRVVAAARSFGDAADATAALDDVAGDPGQSCLVALLETKQDPTFEVIDAFELGADAAAVRVTVPLGDSGLSVVADVVSMRVGRVVATAAFIGAGAPLPSIDIRESMIRWRDHIRTG